MDRFHAVNRSYQRIEEEEQGERPGAVDSRSRRSPSLRGILRPPRIQQDQRRASAGDELRRKGPTQFDLEQGYPSILETDVILPLQGGRIDDASSVSYEGIASIRLPSFVSSDGTETEGSYCTAQLIPAVTSMSIGSGDIGGDSDREFLSCREGSDRLSIFSDAKSFGSRPSSNRDSDGETFYTCRRLNDQGLRSVLAVPTNVNMDQAFNIPLHVFAQSIKEEEHRKEQARYRNRYIWWPVKIMTLIALIAGAIATTVILVKKSRSTDQLEDNTVASVRPFTETTVPTSANASQVPSFAPSSEAALAKLVPSMAPFVAENKQTISPTLFIFITSNFQELDEVP